MQTGASINRFFTASSSFGQFAEMQKAISHGGFYQQIARGLIRVGYDGQNLLETGNKLLGLAEQAHAFRQMKILEQVSELLMNLPLPRQYEAVGQYYQALCLKELGRGDLRNSSHLLEQVAENASPRFRVRAMISLAANSWHKNDFQSVLSLYCEADRLAYHNNLYDPYVLIMPSKMIAVIKSLEGDHNSALTLLENALPVARSVRLSHPHIYYDYLNSLAVELAEVGRLEEAFNASRIALASPYANAYPEWHETRDEINWRGRRASHSVAALSQRGFVRNNVVSLPVSEADNDSDTRVLRFGPPQEPARILNYLEWKNKMAKDLNGTVQDHSTSEQLDHRQMMLRIIKLISDETLTENDLSAMLSAVERIALKRKSRS